MPRSFVACLVVACVVLPTSPVPAHAQEVVAAVPPDVRPERSVRFRGGIAGDLAFMALVNPLEGYAAPTLTGHVGVQLGDVVGLYAAPYAGLMAGIGTGPAFGTAILVDFTIADTVAIGLGPELGYFSREAGGGHHDGAQIAARVHTALYPTKTVDADGRRGLSVGTDLRVMGASVGFDLCPGCEDGGPLMVSASVYVGYEVF
jgi:hypothetical protein